MEGCQRETSEEEEKEEENLQTKEDRWKTAS